MASWHCHSAGHRTKGYTPNGHDSCQNVVLLAVMIKLSLRKLFQAILRTDIEDIPKICSVVEID
jgi:hypothetical protein